MAYKLKGNQLKYCADHIVAYRKMSNGRRLYVDCDDKDSGKKIYMFLSALYKPKNVEMGFTWKDFTMVFPSTYDRDKAYDDLNGAYSEYIEDHPVLLEEDDDSILDPPEDVDDDDDEVPEATKTDYTTYIIIGAAALIIIILLLFKE